MMQYPTNPTGINRANKQGITFTACKIRRDKMQCFVSPAPGSGINPRHKGDFAKYMVAVYRLAKASPNGVEYQAVADSLGWARDTVAIYTNRALKRGLVITYKLCKDDLQNKV